MWVQLHFSLRGWYFIITSHCRQTSFPPRVSSNNLCSCVTCSFAFTSLVTSFLWLVITSFSSHLSFSFCSIVSCRTLWDHKRKSLLFKEANSKRAPSQDFRSFVFFESYTLCETKKKKKEKEERPVELEFNCSFNMQEYLSWAKLSNL